PTCPWSSGNTIPNRLGEFREIRESNERIGIVADARPAGTPGATGVECIRPREGALGLWPAAGGGRVWGGGGGGEKKGLFFFVRFPRFGENRKGGGPLA